LFNYLAFGDLILVIFMNILLWFLWCKWNHWWNDRSEENKDTEQSLW